MEYRKALTVFISVTTIYFSVPEPAYASQDLGLKTGKCAIVIAVGKMTQAAAALGNLQAQARFLSERSRHGRERIRNQVWLVYGRVANSSVWESAMAQCLSGEVHDAFVDWQGVGGFQGGMEDLPPHQRCAVWLAAGEVKESACLPAVEPKPNWPKALAGWFEQDQRGFLMGNYVTDYAVTELAAGNIIKAHELARGVVEVIRRGGIPKSEYRNRALAVMAEAARQKPDPEWEYWARYEAAAGHAYSSGSPVHADPWYAEALLHRCGTGLDCPAEDLQAAREWALIRGSLLPIKEMDDCISALAARQAALIKIWLTEGETTPEQQAVAAAAKRVAAMEQACPEKVPLALEAADSFAKEWTGYPGSSP